MSTSAELREQRLQNYYSLFPSIISLIDAIAEFDDEQLILTGRRLVFEREVLGMVNDGTLEEKFEQIRQYVEVESLNQPERIRFTEFLLQQRSSK